MAKKKRKTARNKAKHRAKIKRGRQQQRQNPKLARIRKLRYKMRHTKLRRK